MTSNWRSGISPITDTNSDSRNFAINATPRGACLCQDLGDPIGDEHI